MSNKTSFVDYDNIKSIVKSLLLTFNNGINIRNFLKRYEEHILEKIPYKELGYCDPELFFLSMPESVDISYSRDGIMILKARSDSSYAHLKNLIDQQKINRPVTRNKNFSQNQRPRISQNYRNGHFFKPPRKQIPEWTVGQSEKRKTFPAEVKFRLCTLISKYPSGLESEELLKAYYHEYRDLAYQNDLSYKDYGFKNCEELFLSLPDYFTVEKSKLRLLFYPHRSSIKEVIHEESKELESNKVMDDSFSSVFIKDFLDDKDPYLHVSIGEVYSPDNFSIIVDGSSLDKLMEEIQKFYVADILKDWKLDNEHIVLNHPVIILCDDVYIRAAIAAFRDYDKVEVVCVDYGTTVVVSKSILLYIHKKFFTLPAQAVSAKLHGIKPIAGIYWENCRSISERFLQLVTDKESLRAEIKEIEPQFEKLSVRIFDTEVGLEDVCINSILVSEGYAQSTFIMNKDDDVDINKGEMYENKACIDKWLQQLPQSSSILSHEASHCNGFATDARMHIDAACQSIYDKRCMLLSQLKDDVDNDTDAHALIILNTCVRALKNVKRILEDFEQ